jgi:hypothetical protein
MSDSHEHVDLHILEQVERLLARHDNEPDGATGEGPGPADLVLVPPLDERGGPPSSTHPAAHVPEQPVIATTPVTPLPRRR